MKDRQFFNICSRLWIGILVIIAGLIVLHVNFGFKERLLKSELIEHAAITTGEKNICLCAICGKRGLAYCLHCGAPMNWDKSSRHFICPSCKRVGHPRCPKCYTLMMGLSGNTRNRRLGTSSPIPVY